MKNFGDLGRKMKGLGKGIEDNSNRLVRKVALAIDANLVKETPVDTGRARANWQVSVGSPITSDIEAPFPGEGGSTGSLNAQAALQQAQAAVAGRRPEQPIYIVNNLEYIDPLDQGRSPQTEAGFVARAVADGVEVARNEKILP